MHLEIDVIDRFVVLSYGFSFRDIGVCSLVIGSGAGNFGVSVAAGLMSRFGCFGMLGCTGIRLFVILVFGTKIYSEMNSMISNAMYAYSSSILY